ncbi:MAG: double-stranded DNA-binding protein [Thermoprotei archaeon]|nr:MAG: double-stranded DNA-binding protein [Thermoprotei archaeon]
MSSDEELELLKMRKLLELRKKLLAEQAPKKEEDPREVVVKNLVGRGLEVLEAAEAQYPEITKAVVKELARLIKEGRVEGPITGEELLNVFYNLGIRVRLPTRIYYEKHGERKGIGELIKERISKS